MLEAGCKHAQREPEAFLLSYTNCRLWLNTAAHGQSPGSRQRQLGRHPGRSHCCRCRRRRLSWDLQSWRDLLSAQGPQSDWEQQSGWQPADQQASRHRQAIPQACCCRRAPRWAGLSATEPLREIDLRLGRRCCHLGLNRESRSAPAPGRRSAVALRTPRPPLLLRHASDGCAGRACSAAGAARAAAVPCPCQTARDAYKLYLRGREEKSEGLVRPLVLHYAFALRCWRQQKLRCTRDDECQNSVVNMANLGTH